MKVSDGEDDDVVIVHRIDEPVRKSCQPATAQALLQQMPCIGITRDPAGRSQDFDEKCIAEARCLRLIPVDRVVEFGFGNIEKPDRHVRSRQERYLAAIMLKSFAESSPRR